MPGQCARFLRGELAHAQVLAASSTAEAVRIVVEARRRDAGGARHALAAEIYGGTVLREGVEDRDDNETRFVWLARAGDAATGAIARDPPLRCGERRARGEWKTSLVFWGAGADSPGWLVRCLDEFGRREINLTKIESRPRRERMGSYMFFADLQGQRRRAGGRRGDRRAARSLRRGARARLLPRGAARRAPAGAERPRKTIAGRHDSSAPSLHSGAADG